MSDYKQFDGHWIHNESRKTYEAGGTINVKSEEGIWSKYVIYRDPRTGIEYARTIHNFKARFTKLR